MFLYAFFPHFFVSLHFVCMWMLDVVAVVVVLVVVVAA